MVITPPACKGAEERIKKRIESNESLGENDLDINMAREVVQVGLHLSKQARNSPKMQAVAVPRPEPWQY
jgi:hypothetical protein